MGFFSTGTNSLKHECGWFVTSPSRSTEHGHHVIEKSLEDKELLL